jgi:hypothetical protein
LGTIGNSQLRELRPPNVVGDFFGGGSGLLTVTSATTFFAPGIRVFESGVDATVAFEVDGVQPFNDIVTMGSGSDQSGDGYADTFAIAEPLPPSEAPGPPTTAFTFAGGTAVYTNSPNTTIAQDGVFDDGDLWHISYNQKLIVEIPSSAGVSVRRIKVCENNSPLPRDRYYTDLNHFRNVKGPYGDVTRFMYGFEKTFHEGRSSLDTRLPFAATLDPTQTELGLGDGIGSRSVEFGNIAFIFKHILWEQDTFLIAGGTGLTVPTGSDTRLVLSNGQPLLLRKNQAVHLMPYIAGLWTPQARFYWQSFLQIDVDLNGDPVSGSVSPGPLPKIGVIQDSSLLFADLSGGYWLTRNLDGENWLRGLAAIAELHYSSTVTDADIVQAAGIVLTDRTRRFDVLNATFGLQAEIGKSATITGGMVFPLRQRDDRQFDNEIAVLANFYF